MKLSLWNEISFLTKIKNFGCRKFVSKCIKELNEACRASRNLQCILLIFSHLYFADQDWPRRGVLRGSKHEVFITYSSHCSVPQALVCSLCDLFHQDMYISSNWAHATSGINRTFDQTINIPLVRKLLFPSRCRSLQSQIRYTVCIKFLSGQHCTSRLRLEN